MLARLDTYFEADESPEEHKRLRQEANGLDIKPRETLENYLDRHIALRQKIVRAQVPGIEQERTTVSYAISGIRARPRWKQLIPILIENHPDTVKELKRKLELLIPSLLTQQRKYQPPRTQKWCHDHQSYGTHDTTECIQIKLPQIQASNKPYIQ